MNCSAIPETLLESELFGHEKGSFTGAVRQKKGRFELADGGTIFLDEIGDMSPGAPGEAAPVPPGPRLQRVGGSNEVAVDVRVIAATNRDLERDVAEGRFREDLYFRLNVVTITVPPLRERIEDVPLLVEHFLRLHAPSEGTKPKKISPRAMRIVMGYGWPGNVRELENAVQRAVVLSRGETIFPEHLPAKVQAAGGGASDEALATGRTMREVERDVIVKTLKEAGGQPDQGVSHSRHLPAHPPEQDQGIRDRRVRRRPVRRICAPGSPGRRLMGKVCAPDRARIRARLHDRPPTRPEVVGSWAVRRRGP